MNRRVLLIDADLAFRDTLTRELQRYKVIVMTEPEADRALQLANADAPSLIMLCIEESDKKAGFRVFEKCKKGALSKVPIVLVTSSVPPDSFAKHRGLKVHADEYIDKRTMSTHELVGKIDGLIALGDPVDEEDLSIPVEDEIPMEIADGDVVLDEVVDHAPADEFDDHQARTVGPNDGLSIDSVMDAETDAAFAALLGDEVVEARVPSVAIAPEVPHESPVDAAVEGVVPEPIHDGRGRGTTPPPILADSVPGVIHDASSAHDVSAAIASAPIAPVAPVEAHDDHNESHVEIHAPVPHEDLAPEPMHAEAAPVPEHVPDPNQDFDNPIEEEHDASRYESLPAIPIDDDDMVALDDDLPVEVEAPEPAASPEPVGPATLVAAAVVVEPARPEPTSQPVKAGSGSHPAIDLGLDKLAQDAESEQSGVYDRRALRKIGELERQIAQLKNELDRARAAGDAAAKGSTREAQFLNLRESMLAKDKELKQVKGDLVSRDQELAEATEKLRQAQHAKTTLEAKNTELEHRLMDDSGKSTQLAASARASAAQLAAMQQELDSMAKAHGAAEHARAQLERDLANERATGAASASEAERLLRVEREQLIARHKNELTSLKSEAQTAQDLALAQLREELETSHGAALQDALEQLRRATATEHQDAVAALERAHASEMVALKADHAGEHSKLRNELGGEVARLEAALATSQAAHQDAIAHGEREVAAAEAAHREAAATHRDALAAAHADHQETLAQLQAKHEATLAQAVNQAAAAHQDELAGVAAAHSVALADQSTQHAVALEELRRGHGSEIEQLQAKHTAELAARDDEHEEARDRELESHGRALSELKSELDRTVAAHEVKLGASKRELAELAAKHDQALAQLHEQHEATLADTVAAHQAEVAKLRADHDQLAEAARRTAETQRAALAEAAAKHDAELSQVTESAGREVAEHKAAAAAAKRAIEDTAARLQAERDAADQAHTQAMAELAAKHERALALSNGEFLKQKSVADAEHAKALAAHKAEAEKARAELAAERDELKRGLSSARDTLKRSEGELASAVQSIADRNAELRSHATAIAERDQRIAELRKEIESIEAENASYQEQVLRAYQKIKADEAMVARARKAMAIALTVLDDEGKPKET